MTCVQVIFFENDLSTHKKGHIWRLQTSQISSTSDADFVHVQASQIFDSPTQFFSRVNNSFSCVGKLYLRRKKLACVRKKMAC